MAATLAQVVAALQGLTTAVTTLKADDQSTHEALVAEQAKTAALSAQVTDLQGQLTIAVANQADPALIQNLLDQITALQFQINPVPTVAMLRFLGDPIRLKGFTPPTNSIGVDVNFHTVPTGGVPDEIDLNTLIEAVDGNGVVIPNVAFTYTITSGHAEELIDGHIARVNVNDPNIGSAGSSASDRDADHPSGQVTFITASDGASALDIGFYNGPM